ncbi:uncharacterized protein BJ212DRAFT_1418382 [Suillus subaureus]|uniref:Secreted protein n=1 Tax=Suillus subaureus TaxID=48587 RepID=A0A9P7DFE0_9AGAM|nr:uncharacterized protein BJ212DRAFT_1418382 [Suillus subaureus]KAG1791933.1 hypothetical protein BJ212DRAFT_1418382 [Suillus subaureus]
MSFVLLWNTITFVPLSSLSFVAWNQCTEIDCLVGTRSLHEPTSVLSPRTFVILCATAICLNTLGSGRETTRTIEAWGAKRWHLMRIIAARRQ